MLIFQSNKSYVVDIYYDLIGYDGWPIATEIHFAFRGLAMSLLAKNVAGSHRLRCSHRIRKASLKYIARRKSGFLFQGVFVISYAGIEFINLRKPFTNHFYDGCLERRTVDSCGNSTCLKTPQSGFLEEAEAVPAESNGAAAENNLAHTLQFYK